MEEEKKREGENVLYMKQKKITDTFNKSRGSIFLRRNYCCFLKGCTSVLLLKFSQPSEAATGDKASHFEQRWEMHPSIPKWPRFQWVDPLGPTYPRLIVTSWRCKPFVDQTVSFWFGHRDLLDLWRPLKNWVLRRVWPLNYNAPFVSFKVLFSDVSMTIQNAAYCRRNPGFLPVQSNLQPHLFWL